MSVPNYTLREFWPVDAQAFPKFAELGINPMVVPTYAFTLLDGFEPIACGGVTQLAPRIGRAWVMLRDPQNGHHIGFARAVKESLEDLLAMGHFNRIEATISLDRPDLERWMEFLGLTREGWMYARTRRP